MTLHDLDSTNKSFKFNISPKSSFHRYKKIETNNGVSKITDACSVDVIIPYHGRYDLVRRCLKSVLQKTRTNPFLVTLVDDGSPGSAATEFAETIKQAPNTNYIRLPKQSGFGAAINVGLNNSTQPYVCILHSDCEVSSLDWLEKLGEALIEAKNDNVKLVVAATNNSDSDNEWFKMADRSYSKESVIVADEALPLHCCLFNRELINRIGGIKEYPYTWFENEELFYRMQFFGYKQAIACNSWVFHEGSGTVNQLLKQQPDRKDVMLENRNRCINDIKLLSSKRR